MSTANITRSLRQSIPYYEQNRDRAAVVLQKGFNAYDRYLLLKPWVFGASMLGLAASSYAWRKRRHIREAHALYPILMTLCGAAAWVTRPGMVTDRAAAEAVASGAVPPDAAKSPLLAYLDEEVAQARRKDPRFADKALQRFVSTPAVNPTWTKMPSYLQALVI